MQEGDCSECNTRDSDVIQGTPRCHVDCGWALPCRSQLHRGTLVHKPVCVGEGGGCGSRGTTPVPPPSQGPGGVTLVIIDALPPCVHRDLSCSCPRPPPFPRAAQGTWAQRSLLECSPPSCDSELPPAVLSAEREPRLQFWGPAGAGLAPRSGATVEGSAGMFTCTVVRPSAAPGVCPQELGFQGHRGYNSTCFHGWLVVTYRFPNCYVNLFPPKSANFAVATLTVPPGG